MLPKKNRADKKAVEKIFKEGCFVNSPHLSFKFILNVARNNRNISFIVPKSTAKSAVKRNMLRRRGYKVLQKYFSEFPKGLSAVFILKTPLTSIQELEQEIKTILRKL